MWTFCGSALLDTRVPVVGKACTVRVALITCAALSSSKAPLLLEVDRQNLQWVSSMTASLVDVSGK